jgi:hypothetical protein
VLSPAFFAKEWAQKELDGLVSRERDGRKVILPIWHGVGFREVQAHSPILADRLAVSSSIGIVDVSTSLYEVVKGPDSLLGVGNPVNESAKEAVTVMIRRPARATGRANDFIINCDGRYVGRLESGGEIMFDVRPGAHTLHASYMELHHHFLDGKYGPSGGSIAEGTSDEVVFDFKSGNYLLETGYERGLSTWFKSVSPLYIKTVAHFD